MNEELGLEKLNDLAIHYPVYLIDAAAEHFNGDECKLEAIAVVLSGLDALCMRIRPLLRRMWSTCWILFRQAPCFPTRSLLSCSIRLHPTVKSWHIC